MRLPIISLVLIACLCLAAGDVAHLKGAKAKLVARLIRKHQKRGAYSPVPPFKLGHDIPHVTHSLLKPLVVTYPPTAAVAAVKVPISPALSPRYPVSVGHKNPHHHFGLKFPHHTRTVLVPKPDQHFHHHHHHVEPKPLVPVVPAPPILPATPLVPVAQHTGTIFHQLPAASPSVTLHSAPEPAVHAHPLPVGPPPVNVLQHEHFNLKPIAPLAPAVPLQPAPVFNAPVFPYAPQFRYVIRPGNAVQTSFFANYPRYPLLNYQNPLQFSAPASPILPAAVNPLVPSYLDHHQPHLIPQNGFFHQAHNEHGVFEQPHPTVAVEPTPTFLHSTPVGVSHPTVHLQPAQPTVHLQQAQPAVHLQPAQPAVHLHPSHTLDHDGWSPVPAQPHDLTPAQQPDVHFQQPLDSHHFTQEQGTQVYEHHTGNDQQSHDQQYHDYQNQLQHHIQQQLDQAQYEQHLNNQHQLNHEYGAPQPEYGQPDHDYSQQNQDFAQHAHEYAQHIQEYAQHAQEYAQTNEYSLHEQQQQQHPQEYEQPGQEYGQPQQGPEGRSSEGEDETQRFHNHIPLGLQPPIDRPLEHFR